MEYGSDYLGRMQYIIYPDGEKVVYEYDEGGQITGIKGYIKNSSSADADYEYVKNIGYDEYGQRVFIEYGNGVKTKYSYDPKRRWLYTVNTVNNQNQQLQNIIYNFDKVGNVSSYTNNCMDGVNGVYSTEQKYGYDGLYQLTSVEGTSIYNPHYGTPDYTSVYTQNFSFDATGNMLTKVSTNKVTPYQTIGDDLNYSLKYNYNEQFAHRLSSVDDLSTGSTRYYTYDANGNLTCESDAEPEEENVSYGKPIEQITDDVQATAYGWGLYSEKKINSTGSAYKRTYTWDERNLLIASSDSAYTVNYVYGQDGQRSNKFTASSETLYFNKMWTIHTDSGNRTEGGQSAKNIYLGDTRIVTKLNEMKDPTQAEERYKQYYYHSDHLGSASLITDYKGEEYQRLEYTPYGEIWVEKTSNSGAEFLPYKFTGKEMDEETGLYYYGARYLDPKYSRWLSTDPALGEYIPNASSKDKGNQNLPGQGGVFNHTNFNLFHYAGNNPVKYVDPDGRNAKYSVDDESQVVTITVPITIYGDGASEDVAKIYEDGINETWNGDWTTTIDGKEYKVKVKSEVTVGSEPKEISVDDSMNYIKVDKSINRSFVRGGVSGEWRKNGRAKFSLSEDNPAPHETGHLLGLKDRYHDVVVDNKTYSVSDDDWKGNIMSGGNTVEQRNIDGILKSLPDLEKKKNGVLKAGRMKN